jgi:hypothetical protein
MIFQQLEIAGHGAFGQEGPPNQIARAVQRSDSGNVQLGYIRMLDLLKEKSPANLKALYEAGQRVARRNEEATRAGPGEGLG